MDSLVSVIIPVYNSEAYLKKCIKSVLSQSYHNIEVLLINDGSTDNSGIVCNKYRDLDSRVRVWHLPNKGPSCVRNFGISHMKGDYLMFVDSDDEMMPDVINESVIEILKQQTDMVLFGYRVQKNNQVTDIIPPGGKYSKREFGKVYIELCTNFLINSPCNKLYKKTIASKCSFPEDMKLGEDLLFCNGYIRNCNSFSLINKPLYLYKQREEKSLSTTYYGDQFSWYIRHYEDTVKTMKFLEPEWDRLNESALYELYGKYIKHCINTCGGASSVLNTSEKKAKIFQMCNHPLTQECLPYFKGNRVYVQMVRFKLVECILLYIWLSIHKK